MYTRSTLLLGHKRALVYSFIRKVAKACKFCISWAGQNL